MTPPNEVPMEAGEYWAATLKSTKPGQVWVGRVHEFNGCHINDLEFRSHRGSIFQPDFNQFDWHKIQLPEGWK